MKNTEILKLLQKKDVLNTLEGNYKFTKAIVINFKRIEEEVRIIKEYVKLSPELVEFESRKEQLLKQYSNNKSKEVDGNTHYDIPKNKIEAYTKDVNNLINEYSEYIDTFKSQQSKQSEALKEECTINFELIDEKDIPEKISIEQMELLINFIKMD